MEFAKGTSESWSQWGQRVVAEGLRRQRAPLQARADALAREYDRARRFRLGWMLLEDLAAKILARQGEPNAAQIDRADAHVLLADMRGKEPLQAFIVTRSALDPALAMNPAFARAIAPCCDGRMRAVVIVPGDYQTRALLVARPLPRGSTALS